MQMNSLACKSLKAAIFEVTGLQISGKYKRYRSRKWSFRTELKVTGAGNQHDYFLFSAEFTDKNQETYTWVVAVDPHAKTITPIDDFDENTQDIFWDELTDLTRPQRPIRRLSSGQVQYGVWLAEMADPRFARHADPDRPQLVLGICKGDPIEHIEELNGEVEPDSSLLYTPRMDLLRSLPRNIRGQDQYNRRKAARGRRNIIKGYLIDDGYVVGVGGEPRENLYTIYVVDLENSVDECRSSEPWVYVGETVLEPEERLQQHFEGHKASSHVRKHGIGLNRRLMRNIPQARFRQDSQFLEKEHAADLKRLGFNVKGGH